MKNKAIVLFTMLAFSAEAQPGKPLIINDDPIVGPENSSQIMPGEKIFCWAPDPVGAEAYEVFQSYAEQLGGGPPWESAGVVEEECWGRTMDEGSTLQLFVAPVFDGNVGIGSEESDIFYAHDPSIDSGDDGPGYSIGYLEPIMAGERTFKWTEPQPITEPLPPNREPWYGPVAYYEVHHRKWVDEDPEHPYGYPPFNKFKLAGTTEKPEWTVTIPIGEHYQFYTVPINEKGEEGPPSPESYIYLAYRTNEVDPVDPIDPSCGLGDLDCDGIYGIFDWTEFGRCCSMEGINPTSDSCKRAAMLDGNEMFCPDAMKMRDILEEHMGVEILRIELGR
jgi:hypothetical protein